MRATAQTDAPQGVLARAEPLRSADLDALLADPHAFLVALDGVIEADYGDWTGRRLSQLSRTRLWRDVQRTPSRAAKKNQTAEAEQLLRAALALEPAARAAGPGRPAARALQAATSPRRRAPR